MSDGTFLEKYVKRDRPDDTDPVEAVGNFFGLLRGHRERAISLEIRKRDGVVLAIPYSRYDQALFDPSEGVFIKFGEQTIRLLGTNLGRELRPNISLITALATHRLAWVREAGKSETLGLTRNQPVVVEVTW